MSNMVRAKHMCAQCHKAFSTSHNLKVHMYTHTGAKPFRCRYPGCLYACTTQANVDRHYAVCHAKTKPFKCQQPDCSAAFPTKGQLTDHSRTHTNERPYHCKECPAMFRRLHHLKTHRLSHTTERPYKCSVDGCAFSANQAQSLCRHNTVRHSTHSTSNAKRAEMAVSAALEAAGIAYTTQHYINLASVSGTHALVDFVVTTSHGGIVELEVDEWQHRYYEPCKDIRRMQSVAECRRLSGDTRPRLLIRFNPDAFQVDGKTIRTYKKLRHKRLVEVIQQYQADSCAKGTQILFMFYDCSTDAASGHLVPLVCKSAAFPTCIGEQVLPAINS